MFFNISFLWKIESTKDKIQTLCSYEILKKTNNERCLEDHFLSKMNLSKILPNTTKLHTLSIIHVDTQMIGFCQFNCSLYDPPVALCDPSIVSPSGGHRISSLFLLVLIFPP